MMAPARANTARAFAGIAHNRGFSVFLMFADVQLVSGVDQCVSIFLGFVCHSGGSVWGGTRAPLVPLNLVWYDRAAAI